jgi:hypothetical protein
MVQLSRILVKCRKVQLNRECTIPNPTIHAQECVVLVYHVLLTGYHLKYCKCQQDISHTFSRLHSTQPYIRTKRCPKSILQRMALKASHAHHTSDTAYRPIHSRRIQQCKSTSLYRSCCLLCMNLKLLHWGRRFRTESRPQSTMRSDQSTQQGSCSHSLSRQSFQECKD